MIAFEIENAILVVNPREIRELCARQIFLDHGFASWNRWVIDSSCLIFCRNIMKIAGKVASMSHLIIGRFVTSILALFIAGSMTHALGQGNALADDDEAAILESLIKLETNHLGAEFSAVRSFSSENIGPLAVLRIAKLGFSLVSASDIERWKREHVLDYVVIRSINVKDGTVTVRVSVVKEGRPCFAPAFSTERSLTYVFKKSANEWVGRLAKRSPPFLFSKSIANPTIHPLR